MVLFSCFGIQADNILLEESPAQVLPSYGPAQVLPKESPAKVLPSCGPAQALPTKTSAQPEVVIHVTKQGAQNVAAMKLFVGIWSEAGDLASRDIFARELRACLTFDNTCDIELSFLPQAPTQKSEITELFSKGYDAALYIKYCGAQKPIEWRLYETQQGSMVCGRRSVIRGDNRDAAFGIAERVCRELTGIMPPFLSKIAYIERPFGYHGAKLWIMDFDGKEAKLLFTARRPLVAPTWCPDKESPFIIVSEFKQANVRFLGIDMTGKTYPVIDEKGTYVGISYNPSSVGMSDLVFGKSGQIWRYTYGKKNPYTPVIANRNEVCASPNLLPNGDIIYCSDGKIKYFDTSKGKSRILISSGYSVAPAYLDVVKSVLYSKRVRKTMQLFIHNLTTNESRQLTFDKGNKIDPCWSPCGRYCAYTLEHGSQSRVYMLSIRSGKQWPLTPSHKICFSPTWSPRLENMLILETNHSTST